MHPNVPIYSTYAVVGFNLLDAFSLLTKGAVLPFFHNYQLSRTPNVDSMSFVPWMDLALGALVYFEKTRTFGLAVCTLFQGLGLWARVSSNKGFLPDLAIFLTTAVALWSTW